MKRLLFIIILTLTLLFCGCASSNFAYNREVTKRNKITRSLVDPTIPYNDTSFWEYFGASALFVLLVWQISLGPPNMR